MTVCPRVISTIGEIYRSEEGDFSEQLFVALVQAITTSIFEYLQSVIRMKFQK